MQEVLKILIGIVVLALGFPIGNILARNTKEELNDGRRWFFILILVSFVGAIVCLILRQDALLFTFLFIAIVTSRSIVGKKKKAEKKTINRKKNIRKKRR